MLEKITRAIEDSKRIFVTTHINPDGDAIGCLLALNCLFREMGRDVTAFMTDRIPNNLRFLPNSGDVVHDLDVVRGSFFDLGIVVDSTDWERTGKDIAAHVRFGRVVNIDHHISNALFGDINLIDPNACAVGEMLYDLIGALGRAISPDVATCLYTSIMTDTGSYTYSNTTMRAFEISAGLVRYGARPAKIAEEINENYSVSRLDLLRLALGTLEFADQGRVGSMTITQRMFKETDTGPDVIEGFIDYPRFVGGVKVAVLFREQPDGGFKVSFRSRDDMDVSQIAGHFGGGGHMNAAGCTIYGTLSKVKHDVFALAQKAIEERAGGGKKRVV